jgi:hydrogenase nickel incorporation protein HypA/HybF
MHEVSLAQNIVDSIREYVAKDKLFLVRKIRMGIGNASGVVSESLIFAFNAIVEETPLANATMETELVPFIVHCHECNNDSENDSGYSICAHCDSTEIIILSGTELILKQIEIDDE